MKKTILRGGKVYAGGVFETLDVLIEDDRIAAIGHNLEAEGADIAAVEGKYVMPGLVDVHVHLREPGFTHKETMATGTASAARGGYTTVCAMPNLNPTPDSRANLDRQLEIIKRDAIVKVIPYGTITVGEQGNELSDMEGMAPDVVGFSDDGRGVQTEKMMERAMREAARVGKPIVAHCEVDELLRGGYIHEGEYCRKKGHAGICSESEWRQVERDLKLVEKTGCQYHVCHVSTKESVELIRQAKARGLRVSCETAPHYLVLCDEDIREDGRFKMNPPLRGREDRAALIRGIQDGTIEIIATDHAPHSPEEKSKGLRASAFGIVGLETAVPVLYTRLVKTGVITAEKMVELMSVAPRSIFDMGGGLEAGAIADITVLDTDSEYTIDANNFVSMGRSTPFEGMTVNGRILFTMVNGRVVYRAD